MEYKEVELSFDYKILAHPVFADKLQDEFDSFITLIKLDGYDINDGTWDYHFGDHFIEYDFTMQKKRFRLLFHIDEYRKLKSMDYYYHNNQYDDVTFKIIVQDLKYPKDNFHHEIENLFKAILSMS